MAQAKYLTALIRAHVTNDYSMFRHVALEVAAIEANAGHDKIARSIRELISGTQGVPQRQTVGKEEVSFRPPSARHDFSGLLHASFRDERLSDLVLGEKTRGSIERVLTEWRNSTLLEAHSLRRRSKLLFVGPPGCGKTLTARSLAGELNLPLFVVKLEGLISRFLGETSVHLSNIFSAMAMTPGVYLFDEFDSIGTTRGEKRDVGEVRRVLSTFLVQIENVGTDSLIIAATNYEELLDSALFRRFDDVINFPMPTQKEIEKLLSKRIASFPHGQMHISQLAKAAKGMNFANVASSVLEAMKTTVIEKQQQVSGATLLKAISENQSAKTGSNNKR